MLRKITIFTAMLLVAVWGARAQSTDTLSAQVLFSQLDTSRIPTGILMDKVLAAGAHFYHSDGENPEAHTLGGFATLDNLWLLRQGAVQDTPVPRTLTLVDSTRSYIAREGNYPVVLADFNYNLIDSLALQDSLLTLQDSVLIDGPDLSASPYQTHRFINANVLDSFYVNSASFVFKPDFYFSNTGMPQNIEIDFGDGQGFRPVTFGTPLTPSYGEYTPNYNGKTATMTVRLRKNGQWVATSFMVNIISCNASVAVPTPSPAPWPNGNNFRFGNISTAPFNVAPVVEGNAYVHYRANPAAGEENLFKKPVIIIEGFETGSYDPNKAENYRMGDLGWCQLWGEPFGILNESALEESPQLFNQLHNDGYDIIMLDFKDSKRSLINNAALARELIIRVNQHKTSDAEPNIIIGASAGGLISRYALAYMEQQGEDHCTNLWISLDAPHKGANISLGAQYLLDFLATNSVRAVSEAQVMRQALNSSAAKQLLLYNIFQSNKGYHPTNQNGYPAILVDAVSQNHLNFRNTLNSIGYPQNLKKVAIASGSRTMQGQGFSGVTKLYRLRSAFSGWQDGAYVDGNLFLDYWDSGGIFMEGWIGFTANLLGFIPVKTESDDNTYRNPANLPSLDRVPGGIRKLAPEIRETVANTSLSGFNFNISTNTAYHRDQCFVPSISALDLNTTDYFFDIEDAIQNNNLPTPFDDVDAPFDNTLHVEITDGTIASKGDNIQFTLDKVYLIEPVSNPVLTTIYNYGEENIVSHEQVINNGVLHLYGNFNDSKTGQTPNAGNTHVYKFGYGCASADLTIEQNGKLIIGDASVNNKAELRVAVGASLTIGSNGRLTIENGSSLIIDDGAEFEFQDGAQITLNGPNATIEFKGKLIVGDDATFTFSGDGHLIFNQDVSQGSFSDYMDIGDNTKMLIGPPGGTPPFTDLLIQVKKPVYFLNGSNTFDEVEIKNGEIDLEQGAIFYTYSPTQFYNVKVYNKNGGGNHNGVRVWNPRTGLTVFSGCTFSDGHPGLMAHWPGGGPQLELQNSAFTGNYQGFVFTDGNFEMTGCTFNDNQINMNGNAMSGVSSISNSTMTARPSHSLGAYFSGQDGAFININDFTAADFVSDEALELRGVDARITCSFFDNNLHGIDIGDAEVFIDDDAGNTFLDNQYDIIYSGDGDETGLYLSNGQNEFTGTTITQKYIQGTTRGSHLQTDYFSANQMNADNNSMPQRYKSSVGYHYPVSMQTTATGVSNLDLYISNNSHNPQDCSNGALPGAEHPYLRSLANEPNSGGLLQSPYPGAPVPLKDEVKAAIRDISYTEDELDDYAALNTLHDILEADINQPDASTSKINKVSYHAMLKALGNCYQFEKLAFSDSGAVLPEVQSTIAVVDSHLVGLNSADSANHHAIFRYNLDKTQIYRVAGNFSQALSIFADKSLWTFNYGQNQRANYWECMCEVERQYFDEEIDEEEYAIAKAACDMQFVGYNYKKEPDTENAPLGVIVDGSELDKLRIYPQPVEDAITLDFVGGYIGEANYHLSSTVGGIIKTGNISWEGTSQTFLDVKSLKPGFYVLSLNFKNMGTKEFKFFKR